MTHADNTPVTAVRQIVMYFAEQKYKWRHAIRELIVLILLISKL